MSRIGTADWESVECRQYDAELWFPVLPNQNSFPQSVCDRCPLRRECLTLALRAEAKWGATSYSYVYGIYGGVTPLYRVRLVERVVAGEKAEVVAREALDRRDHEALVAS